jgi:predicted nucleotidyltransferase
MQYIFILIKRLVNIKIYVCSLVRFGSVLKNQFEIWSDWVVFIKGHPNTFKIIQFFAVFNFFKLNCSFSLDWFGFEYP